MKRDELIRHLRRSGCTLKREGSNHSIYVNPANGKRTAVPRHREIGEQIAAAICAQLEVPAPRP